MRNSRRLDCIDVESGASRWRSESFGKYWSMSFQADKILALDESGTLHLIRANPENVKLMDRRRTRLDAEEALTHDLVTKVVPREELDNEVNALAQHLAAFSPTALANGKEAIYTLCEMEEGASLRYLREAIVMTSRSEDAQEGIAAFNEKRAPEWSGI